MNKSIAEAIEELREDIEEKEGFIKQLEAFEKNAEEGLTEKQYHDLCETPMRYSDLLGKALEAPMPFLEYKKRQPNYFDYVPKDNFNDEEIKFCIPSSRCMGVEVRVVLFQRNEETAKKYVENMNMISEGSCERNIDMAERFFATHNPFKRAKILFRGYRLWFAVLMYFVKGFRRNFKQEVREVKEKAQAELERIATKKATKLDEMLKQRKQQQEALYHYAELLLEWTDKVYVHEQGWDSKRGEFIKENGKVVFIERT